MASRRIQGDIDRLYQLAPGEFIPARNALAKQAGADAPEIRALVKPPIAAWSVNQLYWKRRAEYDALIETSNELRQTHKAILTGRRGDLRAAGKAHDAALDAALKATLALLQDGGQPATDGTRQAIVTTLRALPADEPAGRLARTLQPGGFEMLAGLSIGSTSPGSRRDKPGPVTGAAGPDVHPRAVRAPRSKERERPEPAAEKRAREKAEARTREEAAKAARDLREAEHTARREEFELARAARELDKATKQAEQARNALDAAKQELTAAEAAMAAAERTRDAAGHRADEAQRLLTRARQRVQQV